MSRPDTCFGLPSAHRARASMVLLAALCLTGMSSSAWAGKVYRCGNTFQDQPCAETRPAETRPAERTPSPRQISADCDPGAKEAGARTECVSMKLPRDTARSSAAVAKQ